ncbi:MAG: tRNA (guanosine(46)-N7)-methyltransferase TrmB [Planctomycetaceae bacterium]
MTQSRSAPPTDLKPYFLTIADVGQDFGGTLNWRSFFGNDQPVELDIGCGRGLFLVTAGEANPQINYLGIEIDYREGRHAAKRMRRRRLSNVRVLGGDAQTALRELIVPQTIAAVHVYFPDPWWKKKHRRRRVFTDRFVDLCAAVLAPGGLLHSWTDVGEYFEVISALMSHDPRFLNLPPPDEHQPAHDMDYQTSFERKRRQAGATIFRGRWQRLP